MARRLYDSKTKEFLGLCIKPQSCLPKIPKTLRMTKINFRSSHLSCEDPFDLQFTPKRDLRSHSSAYTFSSHHRHRHLPLNSRKETQNRFANWFSLKFWKKFPKGICGKKAAATASWRQLHPWHSRDSEKFFFSSPVLHVEHENALLLRDCENIPRNFHITLCQLISIKCVACARTSCYWLRINNLNC